MGSDAPKKLPKWWTDERKAKLIELWETHSNSIIAEIIGDGCTRNAVSGAAHRFGLRKVEPNRPPKPPKPRKRRKLTEQEKAIRRKPKVMSEIIKGEDMLPLLDSIQGLTSENCAYPYGVMAFKFCGRPRDRGSFCEAHANLCYQAHNPHSHSRPFFRIR